MGRRIVIAVGGTGGHIVPAEALAKALEGENELLFVGVSLDTNRYYSKRWPWVDVPGSARNVWKLLRGVCSSVRALRKFRPDVVVGYGSYHAFPALAAAWLLRIPYILYEANASFGRVNRLFARGASRIGSLLGDLPRAERVRGPVVERQRREGEKKCLLVFGGSQGAAKINAAFMEVARQFDVEVIHLIGKHGNLEEISNFYHRQNLKVCVKVFEENMELAYNRANLAICRSGAGTVSELMAHRLPAVLIPYPYASEGHQLDNARLMARRGGAIVLEESDLTPQTLLKAIARGLAHEETMRAALEKCSTMEGERHFNEMILNYLGDL